MKEKKIHDESDYYFVPAVEDDEVDEECDEYEEATQNENRENKSARQEFRESTRKELMLRAGLRCSNPYCRKMTVAYDSTINKIVSIGEAAHIVAAKVGGPRNNGDDKYTSDYIRNIDNGIWLCSCCHSMIDKSGNDKQFSFELLHEWKTKAESIYIEQISKPRIDFLNSIKEDIIGRVDFKFEEATGLQIALVTYLVSNDTKFSFLRKNQYHNDDMDPSDYFYDAYKDFFDWITTSNNQKLKKILNMQLPSPTIWNMNKHQNLKLLFEDALLADNFSQIVIVTNKEITISSYDVSKVIFHDNSEAIDEYLQKIYS